MKIECNECCGTCSEKYAYIATREDDGEVDYYCDVCGAEKEENDDWDGYVEVIVP